MRLWLVAVLVAASALAYVLPTESLDVFYWATPSAVKIVGLDGRVLWTQQAVYPLIATDRTGRCLAIANRLYIYDISVNIFVVERSLFTTVELSPQLVETLAQYGIRLPQEIPVVLNLSLPLPPVILASVYKTTVVSLHTPYGYPHWAINLGPRANVTAIATNCEYVVAATIFGEVYVVRDGRIVDQFFIDPLGAVPRAAMNRQPLDPPITALTIINNTVYVGTLTGDIYRFKLPTEAELRSGRFDRGFTRLGSCGGPVYGLYTNPTGDPIALCFVKRERPYVVIYPYGLTFADPVLITYGIDTPRLVSAVSQDGRWVFVAVNNEIIGIRDGRVALKLRTPATPSAIASSWNGSVVAVGTLAGHFYLFKDGIPTVRTDPISTQLLLRAVRGNATGNFTIREALISVKPVTSVAVSFDGQVAALEYWDSVYVLYTARLPYVVDAPSDCLPLEAAVVAAGSKITYIYTLNKSGVLYVPYGEVVIYPLYRYLGDVRCKPERNFTLTIFGDVAEPLVFRYFKQFRVYRQPAELVSGPDWASGPTRFSAALTPSIQVQVSIETIPALADRLARLQSLVLGRIRAVIDSWEVDGKRTGAGFSFITVDVQKPTVVKAVYRVEAPDTVSEDEYGINLVDIVVYDSFGNIIDVGRRPLFSVYPVVVVARYTPSFLVTAGRGATVNGTDQLWAEYQSVVVFRATPVIEYGNGTREVFAKWLETGETSPEIKLTVTGPVKRTPVYVKQYLVSASPPARFEGVAGNATWVEAGKSVRVSIPAVLAEQGSVRTAFKNWVVNGIPNATLNNPVQDFVVKAPLNITYQVKRQYLVILTSRFGVVPQSMWVDEGSTVAVVPNPTSVWSPPPLHYVFVGWRDVSTGVVYSYPQLPVAYGPMTLEAVWAIDPIPLVLIAGAAAGAVALIWFLRRRRLARLMAEVAE
ncbi:hypothetical protein PAE0915 [Pyrobaculum aerophilum str. IM2]|uniref:Uncharacterized protein n=2 Tax=Pyrobaculum aerophilum TaxID=13773 RepID=Q8ZY76_PYRAE|nr:hypothetical protein [Pyrobaculum aerophilum]AAL63120.1 hypothetical protein PAE0915 [Pyrobaculum aerophilum str. IM2]HII48116.1 hypothetical protein [Pyrobaculum aerophilum]